MRPAIGKQGAAAMSHSALQRSSGKKFEHPDDRQRRKPTAQDLPQFTCGLDLYAAGVARIVGKRYILDFDDLDRLADGS